MQRNRAVRLLIGFEDNGKAIFKRWEGKLLNLMKLNTDRDNDSSCRRTETWPDWGCKSVEEEGIQGRDSGLEQTHG
jgi:hypothetical protein